MKRDARSARQRALAPPLLPQQFVLPIEAAFGVIDVETAESHARRRGLSSLPRVQHMPLKRWRLDVLLDWQRRNGLERLPHFGMALRPREPRGGGNVGSRPAGCADVRYSLLIDSPIHAQ